MTTRLKTRRRRLAAGFEGIELAIAQSGVLSVTSSREDCRDIRACVDAHGLHLNSIRIGFGQTEYFAGMMGDVRLYDRVLSDEEIRQLATMPLPQ